MIQSDNKQGFSLVEVVIFIGILSLFFVTGMAVTTYSLRMMKANEYRLKASHYAEELMEWIKLQKERDWTLFASQTVGTGKSYCFNSSISDSTIFPAQGACAAGAFTLDGSFRRNVDLTPDAPSNPSKIDVDVTVQWNEAGNVITIPLSSVLTVWE